MTEKEEWGSGFLTVVGSEGLAPGVTTPTLTIRSQNGYTGADQTREDMLHNSQFVDAEVELFAKLRFDTVETHRRVCPWRADSSPNKIRRDSFSAYFLDRRLGPLDASAIVISNVIGVGIFTTPGVVANILPNSTAMLSVWAFGGALAFAGALAYAELAAWRPQAGGEHVYLRRASGAWPPSSQAGRRSWLALVGPSRPAQSPSRSIWIDLFPAPETRQPLPLGGSALSRSPFRRGPSSRSSRSSFWRSFSRAACGPAGSCRTR